MRDLAAGWVSGDTAAFLQPCAIRGLLPVCPPAARVRLKPLCQGPNQQPRDESDFAAWVCSELSDVPGRATHRAAFAAAEEILVRWRRRFAGTQAGALWKRLMKPRVFKEIVETAPVVSAVRDFVQAYDANSTGKLTIIDLCSGKGYLSMLLSEQLPPDKVEKIILVDKQWPLNNREWQPGDDTAVRAGHINWDHIYGAAADGSCLFDAWPIPLVTSKQDIKPPSTLRAMRRVLVERAPGPVIVLAVHLCGTLSLKAIQLFNENPDRIAMIALKPCCLPPMVLDTVCVCVTALRLVHDGMYISCIRGAAAPTSSTTQVHVKRADVFRIGEHAFPASDVCSNGRFRGDIWTGPPRAAVRPVFDRWTRHLLAGLAPSRGWHTLLHRASRLASCRADTHSRTLRLQHTRSHVPVPDTREKTGGVKALETSTVQAMGGFQNAFLYAQHGPVPTPAFWDGLAARREA